MQLPVALGQKPELVVQMSMNRRFHGCGAGPDSLSPKRAIRKPSSHPPQLHSFMMRQGRASLAGIAA